MNIQYSRAADERRVMLGHAMEGAEIISAIYSLTQAASGIQRMRNG
ncbi:hypothetical protein CSC26_4348 [Pseudomonas aeruginosa]|nr:hypothetical protein CSC26_4348 [Pseudomonas aeruginosa]